MSARTPGFLRRIEDDCVYFAISSCSTKKSFLVCSVEDLVANAAKISPEGSTAFVASAFKWLPMSEFEKKDNVSPHEYFPFIHLSLPLCPLPLAAIVFLRLSPLVKLEEPWAHFVLP